MAASRVSTLLCASLVASVAYGMSLPPHYDLASLVVLSDAIVRAERGEVRDDGARGRISKLRCTKVYYGPQVPGEEIEVRGELSTTFNRSPLYKKDEVPLDREAVVFLVRDNPRDLNQPRSAASRLPDSRYVRYLYHGSVYRSNDDPLGPSHAPQPRETRGVWVGKGPATLAEFESDLADAIARVQAFRAALGERDAAVRREKTVALFNLPPSDPVVLVSRRYVGVYKDDAFGSRAAEALFERGDLSGALEVCARARLGPLEVGRWARASEENTARVLEGAWRQDLPLHQRAAALGCFAGWLAPEALPANVAPLVNDREATVRRCAIRTLGSTFLEAEGAAQLASRYAAVVSALVERWRTEEDPFARLDLAVTGKRLSLLDRFSAVRALPEMPFAAGMCGAAVHYEYMSLLRSDMRFGEIIAVAVKDGDRMEFRSKPLDLRARDPGHLITLGDVHEGTAPLQFEPPLAPGTYEVRLDGCVQRTQWHVTSPPFTLQVPAEPTS